MVYYDKKTHKLIGFRPSKRKNKMYDAILVSSASGIIHGIPFGDKRYQNYQDRTGLNAYPHLIHGDKKRRKMYQNRHKSFLRDGYYSPGYFSYYYLW